MHQPEPNPGKNSNNSKLICNIYQLVHIFPQDRTEYTITYSEEVEDDAEDVEEGVHEGPSCHTAPVLAEEPDKRARALGSLVGVVGKVPFDCVASDDVVNQIKCMLQESLTN